MNYKDYRYHLQPAKYVGKPDLDNYEAPDAFVNHGGNGFIAGSEAPGNMNTMGSNNRPQFDKWNTVQSSLPKYGDNSAQKPGYATTPLPSYENPGGASPPLWYHLLGRIQRSNSGYSGF